MVFWVGLHVPRFDVDDLLGQVEVAEDVRPNGLSTLVGAHDAIDLEVVIHDHLGAGSDQVAILRAVLRGVLAARGVGLDDGGCFGSICVGSFRVSRPGRTAFGRH